MLTRENRAIMVLLIGAIAEKILGGIRSDRPKNDRGKTMTNIDISLNQTTANRQLSQQNLRSGQKVYLYNDPKYTGTLMRPVERTYPPKWTVELDRGGYEAANLENIYPLESPHSESQEKEILKADRSENISSPSPTLGKEAEKVSQLEQQIEILQNTIRQLEEENKIIRQQYRELERENQRLKEELTEAKKIIRRAKDISPLMRISRKRVMRLAHNAVVTSA